MSTSYKLAGQYGPISCYIRNKLIGLRKLGIPLIKQPSSGFVQRFRSIDIYASFRVSHRQDHPDSEILSPLGMEDSSVTQLLQVHSCPRL